MRFSIYLFFLSTLLLFGNCAPKGGFPVTPPPPTPPEGGNKLGEGEPAQGQINGQQWVFQGGRAYALTKFQQNYVVVQLWNEKHADPCSVKLGSTLQVRLMAPFASSNWSIAPEDPFNANISIFFTDYNLNLRPWDNLRADQGEIRLGDLNSQEVRGFFAGTFNNARVGETNVEGEFVVPFCPPSRSGSRPGSNTGSIPARAWVSNGDNF